MQPILGIGGVATSGKDTFGRLLIEGLDKRGYKARRFAFADELKQELAPSILAEYGIDIFTCSLTEKNLVRPLLVFHGEMKRLRSNGTYWIRKVEAAINRMWETEPDVIPVITDVRYAFYPNDEVVWIQQEKHGLVIHVQRYIQRLSDDPMYVDNISVPPANEVEAEHDGELRKRADYPMDWFSAPANSTPAEINEWCRPYVTDFLLSDSAKQLLDRCSRQTATFA